MSDNPSAGRPRVRVPAGGAPYVNNRTQTFDSVSNFAARIGIGNPNLLSETSYSYIPISRLQQLMEWMYRSSWIVGAAVDAVADDMTRAGVTFNSDTPPDDIEEILKAASDLDLWQMLNQAIKWGRLYGGGLMVMLIDGQDFATELDPDSISEDQLKGFTVLDRWMVQQSFNELVTDYGPDYGLPKFYDVIATAPFMPRMRVHYSRVVRIDGVSLPFRQRLAENGWGMSVIERLYDRLVAFDSGTMGAAQLLYKAYLRTYKVKDFRRLVAIGGEATEGFHKAMELMRMLQSNEGLTVIDMEDEFETHEYSFGGVSETLLMLGQQISGALGIPLVRLFGQSPAGLNSTGDSDWRNYETMVNATQEARLRRPLTTVFKVLWRSTLGTDPPPTFGFKFNPLTVLTEAEKAEIAQRDADTIKLLHDGGVITTTIALKELKQSSVVTGRFTNIQESDIKDSEEAPAPWEQPPPGQGLPGMPGAPGAAGAAGGKGGAPGANVPGVPGGTPPPPGKSNGAGLQVHVHQAGSDDD
jgi:hypothetical protein